MQRNSRISMRHWSPWIEEVVAQMVETASPMLSASCAALHFSKLSVAKYCAAIADGREYGAWPYRVSKAYRQLPRRTTLYPGVG